MDGQDARPDVAAAWAACSDIADRAYRELEAQVVSLARVDLQTGTARLEVVRRLQSGAASAAIRTIQRVFPGWNLFQISFRIDVNSVNVRLYRGGETIAVSGRELAEGALPAGLYELSARLYPLDYAFAVPIKDGGTVLGALVVHSVAPLSENRRLIAQSYAKEVGERLASRA